MRTGRRPVVAIARRFALLACAHLALLPTGTQADVASSMAQAFEEMGAAANVTGPSAFQGQSAGYYSLGNVWVRMPQKTTTVANLQLPNARAGCGGIDLFTGSFSFVNSGEIVALMKAVANNAAGFAFKIAIDTICPECGHVLESMRQAAQLMNNFNINSCEAAQGLVGAVWPQSDLADKAFCESIGNSSGLFTDYAAAKHGCGSKGERAATVAAADPLTSDVNPALPRNFTWEILKKTDYFKTGGTYDYQMMEYVMSLVGTIIYQPPGDASPGAYSPVLGDASGRLATALLDGAGAPAVQYYKCDEHEKCLNPTLTALSLQPQEALRAKVRAMIDAMAAKARSSTPLTEAEKGLLQVATIPLYKVLVVQAAYGRGLNIDDRDTLAEITAIDLLFAQLDHFFSIISRSKANFIASDEAKLEAWTELIGRSQAALANRQREVHSKVSVVMEIIQRTAFLESMLAAQMAAPMAASLDWSRSISASRL